MSQYNMVNLLLQLKLYQLALYLPYLQMGIQLFRKKIKFSINKCQILLLLFNW